MSTSPIEVRLSEEDREAYGPDGWMRFDINDYDKLAADELIRLEQEMGVSFFRLRRVEIPERTALSQKVTLWLARWAAGHRDVSFADFNCHPLAAEGRSPGDDDADPLEPGSSSTTDGETAPSSSSTSSEKPGSRKVSRVARRRSTANTPV